MASGVSEATVVRMCQHAGYTGYWPFRTMLARDMGMMGREEKRDNDQANIVAGIFRKYADIMQNLSSKIDLDAMSTCARLIDNCHEVHVIAAGDTGNPGEAYGILSGQDRDQGDLQRACGLLSEYHQPCR